jgi:sugar lactone lactonase YvrE
MKHRRWASLAAAALLMAAVAPASADDIEIETVAFGLHNPRGIALAPDGSLYVAEAGAAGDICPFDFYGQGGFCVGLTGSVARVHDGIVQRVVAGLPSGGAQGQIGGPSDVVVLEDGSLYVILNLGGDPGQRDRLPLGVGELRGWLVRVDTEGEIEPVADVAAFEGTHNPDASSVGGSVETNPHSVVALADGAAVADAGGNSLVRVAPDGSVSLLAVFPTSDIEYPADALSALAPGEGDGTTGGGAVEMVTVPVQSVPTSVTLGPDGSLYVGELTGAPFPVGGAAVWRVPLDGGQPSIHATGFSAIMDLAFGPDGSLYVAELAHDGLLPVLAGEAPPIGAVVRVPPDSREPEVIVSDARVPAPGGIAVDDDGAIYLAVDSTSAEDGRIVRISPVVEQEPETEVETIEVLPAADA